MATEKLTYTVYVTISNHLFVFLWFPFLINCKHLTLKHS